MAKTIDKKNIKVCFFSPSSYSFFYKDMDKNFGGAELQMFLLAKSLSEMSGFKVSFFIGNYGQKKIDTYKKINLIRSISLPKYENVFFKSFKIVKLFLLLKKHKPEIIVTTTANSLIGIISFFTRILKIKHLHRTAHQKDVDFSWIEKNGIKGKVYKYGLENADKIITQSLEYQKLLKENHNLQSDVLRNAFIAIPSKNVVKKGFLWVGRFQSWKRPDIFINLASKMEGEHFTMICPYNKKDKKEWEQLKQKAETLKNITFIKKVPFTQIQNYFNKSQIFINTSDFEGFPNTFLQAAQAKTPIISLNVSPDNFISKYNCGIFCEGSFETMEKQALELLKNKQELKNKGENNFNYLKINHDINKIGKQLEQLISEII